MTKRILLGMLTPSSNTVLEPVTTAMISELPEVSVHFGRFRVTQIALSDQALGQFEMAPILEAARMLADARVDVIAWNGTSSGWLGFETDRELCRLIMAETGIPATTSVLALNEILERTGAEDFALVTPYLHDVQAKIVTNYTNHGFTIVAEQHLNDPGNFSFSEFSVDTIAGMVRAVATSRPKAISTFCTNLRAAPLVADLERETGIPIYDTISVAVWKSLVMAGVEPGRVTGWGRLFQDLS